MKNSIKKIAIILALLYLNLNLALAAGTGYTVPNVDDIFKKGGSIDWFSDTKLMETSDDGLGLIEAVSKLPKSNPSDIINTAVKTVLSFSMILTLISLIAAAIYYLISNGDEAKTSKAKHIILYLLIGMAIIAGSLGVVTGITQFKFLE